MSNNNNNLQTQTISNALTVHQCSTIQVTEGSSETTTEGYMENYKNVSQDIRDQLNAKAEAVQIILKGIYNDIYYTVDAFPNACEMWKVIERLKQGESINVQDLETNLYCRANQDNSLRINRGTGYENQRVVNVAGARETVGTQVVKKSGIQCYNCKEYGYVSRECQKPKRAKDTAYHKEKMLLCKQEEAEVQLNAEQADWKDDTDDESDDQELEAHYMYMAQIHKFTQIEHPEQPKSVNDTYLEEQGDTNITIDSLDMCYDKEQDDQDDTDELAQERNLLASLIKKLKCEIDDSQKL
ncbi:retrovirus-related pol polyprotein from transposon TNT 1-94 [Tanacetum coccineum]|uniref:Retrovirus-related pol polyprotein from transposon TNT 1-94 n=1 Tax=Tanacetum coccineum TaxID=301880 RepID=A0ABQ4YAW6_9ASTR